MERTSRLSIRSSDERTSRRRWASLAIVVLAGVSLAPEQRVEACGPDFPTNMLIRRADALATMWDGSFDEGARSLVPVAERDRELFARSPDYVVAMPVAVGVPGKLLHVTTISIYPMGTSRVASGTAIPLG